MRILIIGGTDGFGKWVANYINTHFLDQEIIVTGRNHKKGECVSRDLGVIFTADNGKYISTADIVIFAVPIAHMEKIIKSLAPKMKEGVIVADVCSIKQMPASVLQEYSPHTAIIIPVHPMFGPFVSSIADQVFVLCPQDIKTLEYQFLVNYIGSQGGRVIESSAEYHDRMMAMVQWMTHFNMFMTAGCIRNMNLGVRESMDFISPIYKMLISCVGRYVSHNPGLYYEIQKYNPYMTHVRKLMMDSAQELSDAIEYDNEDVFVELIDSASSVFWDQSQRGQEYTDKLIYLMSQQVEIIKKSVGIQITLRHIYSADIVSGVLTSYNEDYIFFDKTKYPLSHWVII